ncbi:MAG: hypothetical protein HYT40_01345 [Candidatus Sungbacteria bacterium]|uniref:Uncharacterized protein n=1 Tax=Candidatus Sungiibacteriota bacterium TaxID=2750080 RepID=A0A931SD53_9BACT|nr:hypothetical protein [Candidatus Sungbacteria bacterium]
MKQTTTFLIILAAIVIPPLLGTIFRRWILPKPKGPLENITKEAEEAKKLLEETQKQIEENKNRPV